MKRTILAIAATATLALAASATTVPVKQVHHAGPFRLANPIVIDSVDNAQNKFSAEKLIDTPLAWDATDNSPLSELTEVKLDSGTLNMVSFGVKTSTYVKDAEIKISGTKHMKISVDGTAITYKAQLQPGYHSVSVKFIADSSAIDISIPDALCECHGAHPFTLADNLATRVPTQCSISPSGRWALVAYSWYDTEYKLQGEYLLCDIKNGTNRRISRGVSWMPSSDRYYYTERQSGSLRLIAVDPATGTSTVLARDLPDEYFYMSPTEDYLVLMHQSEGPKKEDGVFEILHPDDRQPGWRTRYDLKRYDLATGFVQPLTYTYHPVSLYDISADGRHLLVSVTTDSITQRPTTRQSFYDLDIDAMSMTKLVDKDGFINGAIWADGNSKVVFKASTEAFAGIGNRVPEGSTPNMYDLHMYVLDCQSGTVTPTTADDATSIEDMEYSPSERAVYYTAQNADSVSLYRMDLASLTSVRISQPLEVLTGLSVASKGGNIVVRGSSACTPYKVLAIDKPASKRPTISTVLAPNDEMYASIELGTAHPWSFQCNRGYTVTGFYYLPANFDPAKKYPMIVHYYGGCSPTSRRFGGGSHYPAHYWNALGYIVLIVNPSGASGFGQEWASRHVNTMGEGPAQDIIDATRQFARDVAQVDSTKIGCVSASYGGFMTQYMLTKDNPFACGISHAGISDHTSYWGEGYWGYSYSEVSAANSYPWTRKDLYVDRSPLYNADKITKPLLFTHGTADTNVPIGESIQMYTALRLLGVPTAFVEVEGENHGIMDPAKRVKWINTMVAWFQRWLNDDPSWWDAIYTPKKL